MQGVGSAQKQHLGRFPGGLRPPRESLALRLYLQRAPVHLPAPHTAWPHRPASTQGRVNRGHLPGRGPGLRSMLWVRGEVRAAPNPTAFSETLRVRQAGGCRPPKHPWVRRKNKPQHPLLSGLNNRWPLVFSFHQREGTKTAGLVFAASLESSLSRQRPRKINLPPGVPSWGRKRRPCYYGFHFPEAPGASTGTSCVFLTGPSLSRSVSLSLAPYLEARK